MEIRKVTRKDFEAWLNMGIQLWPEETPDELRKESEEIFTSARQRAFIGISDDGDYIGFINVSTRREYVPGADSYPVGCVEGIYVKPEYRRQGVARKLVESGEKWALEKGCRQMGSDVYLANTESQAFHRRIGFIEKERTVHYIKQISKNTLTPNQP